MKKIYKKLYRTGGSLTVEASLVIPLIILAIAAVLYISILLYQYAYLKAVSNEVAERGAASWGNISRISQGEKLKLESGELKDSKKLLSDDLYWRITGALEGDKIRALKKYTLYKLKERNLLESEISKLNIRELENRKDKVDIWIRDYIIYKELNVVIRDSYKIPLGNSLKIFGIDNTYNIHVHSKSVIDDPLEFIRNTDFITDTLKQYEKTDKILDSFKENMDKIKENIESFFGEKGGGKE